MSEMVKQPIFFLTPEAIKDIYKDRELPDYSNIGVQLDQKLILSQILYGTKRIVRNPYSLYVNPKTLIVERRIVIDYILNNIVIPQYQNGKSLRTSTAKIQKIITFIDWVDTNDIDFLQNKAIARTSLENYTLHLKTNIRQSMLSQGEAHARHFAVMNFLRSIHNDKTGEITAGIRPIPNKREGKVVKSSDENMSYSFNFYYSLFSQIADFLLNDHKYPFKLNLPGENLWVIPSQYWIKPKHREYGIMAFDYTEGRIRAEDEITNLYGLKYLRDGRWARKEILAAIEKNNIDPISNRRLMLGSIAIKAYFMHFLAITGMNDSTAATLPWLEEYSIEKTKQKFRNIKYRAGSKVVDFQIQREFMDDFRKFLKLRSLVLNGGHFDYMFFVGYGQNVSLSNNQKVGSFSSSINAYMIKNIDPDLPKINSKQSRVNKTHQVIKQNGIITASQLAQSSKNTIIKHYLGESEESSAQQIAAYFKALNNGLIAKDGEGTSISIGQCRAYGSPSSAINNKDVISNCSQAEGCLFCDKYCLHADESDIRKLISLEFVINESRYIAKNEDHFLGVFSLVLDRIGNILTLLKNEHNKENLVEKIRIDVFENENLSPFWEHKLSTLIDMGILK